MMLDAFEVDEETAVTDINGFLDTVIKAGFIADEEA